MFFRPSIWLGKEGSKIDHEHIVQRAAQGDKDAFRILVDEYKNIVFAICMNVVHDPYEAENLTQDTFLQVYKSLSSYQHKGFKTWLSRIALNKAIDYKRKASARIQQESICLEDIDTIADDSASVQDLIIKEEEKNMLKECLKRMPEHYGTIIRKCYQENKSSKEIALEENISVRTVETRLYRGKRILREYYEELSKT